MMRGDDLPFPCNIAVAHRPAQSHGIEFGAQSDDVPQIGLGRRGDAKASLRRGFTIPSAAKRVRASRTEWFDPP